MKSIKIINTDLLVLLVTLFWLSSLGNNLNVLEIVALFITAIMFLLMVVKTLKNKR